MNSEGEQYYDEITDIELLISTAERCDLNIVFINFLNGNSYKNFIPV